MNSRGFTLLELLVVLAIMTLAITLVAPLVSSAMPGVAIKSAARELTAGLRLARSRAIAQNREIVFRLDVQGRRYTVGMRGKVRELPDDIDISFLTARSEQFSDSAANVRFFPDGGSTGGRIRLSHGKREFTVLVDWLTGRISVVE